ncbi:MAG: hypothetical protein ACYSSO_01550 [Planctomycetota bacterium]|jgi:hypothetical protein
MKCLTNNFSSGLCFIHAPASQKHIFLAQGLPEEEEEEEEEEETTHSFSVSSATIIAIYGF